MAATALYAAHLPLLRNEHEHPAEHIAGRPYADCRLPVHRGRRLLRAGNTGVLEVEMSKLSKGLNGLWRAAREVRDKVLGITGLGDITLGDAGKRIDSAWAAAVAWFKSLPPEKQAEFAGILQKWLGLTVKL